MSNEPVVHVVLAMEEDILAVRRWAGVLSHLGSSPHMIEPAEVHVIANVLHHVGASLEREWKKTLDAERRRA